MYRLDLYNRLWRIPISRMANYKVLSSHLYLNLLSRFNGELNGYRRSKFPDLLR